jgi:hypothetical protein
MQSTIAYNQDRATYGWLLKAVSLGGIPGNSYAAHCSAVETFAP